MNSLPSVNFFNVLGTTNAKTPLYVPATKYQQPTTAAFVDEMIPTPTGGFLVTCMVSLCATACLTCSQLTIQGGEPASHLNARPCTPAHCMPDLVPLTLYARPCTPDAVCPTL